MAYNKSIRNGKQTSQTPYKKIKQNLTRQKTSDKIKT